MKVGKYFSLDEFTSSQTASRKGLDNTPPDEEITNIKLLCQFILDPLRENLQRPIVISSGYRSPKVNAAVGGALSSQHVKGQAADILVPGLTVAEVVFAIRHMDLPFDQLLDEFGSWTHVSYKLNGRREALNVRRSAKGKVTYERMG